MTSQVNKPVWTYIFTLITALLLGLALQVWPAEYVYETIDVPFPGAHSTSVTGINVNGLMVGSFSDAQNALWGFTYHPTQGGTFTRVYLASRFLSPQGVNANGHVVGTSSFGCFRTDSFVYESTAELGALWRVFNSTITEAMDINDAGSTVGDYLLSGRFHGFYRSPSGQIETIDIPAATSTAVNGINSFDHLVGNYLDSAGFSHGFLYVNGALSGIDYPGAPHTFLESYTDAGLLVGTYLEPTSFIGIGFTTTDGQNFDQIFVPGAQQTFVKGASATGAIVGNYLDQNSVYHGFVAIPNGTPMAALSARARVRRR